MEKLMHFLFLLLSGSALVVLVHAQDQSEFISLDCGLPEDSSYTEATTGINYISDAAYIDTGKSRSILPDYRTGMQRQAWYVRSFPEGVRNCYNLTLPRGNKYLIRATFFYGNYDGLSKLPQFDIHLGPNKWSSVKIDNASIDTNMEIIHAVSSKSADICLVNVGSGIPFISSLEFRLLNNKTYVTSYESLNLFARLDIAPITNHAVRFNNDIYDRAWYPYMNSSEWANLSTLLTIDSGDLVNDFRPAPIVMRTAATPLNASAPLDIHLDTSDANLKFYVYMHFAELEELQANHYRAFNIYLNGKYWHGPIVPDYLHTTTVYQKSPLTGGKYEFSIHKTENSTLPPILNAFEAYTVHELMNSHTDQTDVDAIVNIKLMYGVKRNWQGDPCAPQVYMWEGLNCSYDAFDPPRITFLNLSSSGLNGRIPLFISNLTLLEYLDLSNNKLTGRVPNFLPRLPLKFLNLEGNNLSGSVPAELIERSKNSSLSLRVGGNPYLCASIACKKKASNFVVPVVASVASIFILITALAGLWFLKRRQQEQGKVEFHNNNDNHSNYESFELKNHQFTCSDLQRITKNFERVLGGGGFGKVYHGYLDEVEVAVKMLSASSGQGYQQFQAEVKLLMRVHHRNLTSLVGYCIDGSTMGLIYEYMAHGNLQEHLSDSSSNILTWEGRLRIAVDAAQGLEYLHHGCKPPIIHRDVKSSNILLDEKFQAKLGDFGLSRAFSVDNDTHVSTVVVGTPGYLDPEYYRSNRLTEKSDVYSFGAVLLEIITSRPVIERISGHEKTHIGQWVSLMLNEGDIKKIVDPRLYGDFDTNTVWKAVEIAMSCLSPSSTDRPAMNQVLVELNECLAIEKARTNRSRKNESKDSVDMFTMNLLELN